MPPGSEPAAPPPDPTGPDAPPSSPATSAATLPAASTPVPADPTGGGATASDQPGADDGPDATGAAAPAGGNWLDRIPIWTVPALLLGIPLLVALATLAWPQLYDDVVWQYFWGPIHADANGRAAECLLPDGTIQPFACSGSGVETQPGYTVVNTAAWAVLLGICIVGAGQMLQRFGTRMDARLIVGATLWVVAGSVFHVLEDAKLFGAPLRYVFITPIIYLLFAAFGIVSFLLGQYLRTVATRTSVAVALQKLWLIIAVPVLLYLFLYLERWDQVALYLNPIWIAVFGVIPFAVASFRFQRIGRVDPSELVGILSIGWILAGLAYVLLYATSPWNSQLRDPLPEALWAPALALAVVFVARAAPIAMAGLGVLLAGIVAPLLAFWAWDTVAGTLQDRLGVDLHLRLGQTAGLVLWAVAALAIIGLAARNALARWGTLRPAIWEALRNPINLLILFAQMADAFATAIGIDLGDYREKHVFSEQIIDGTAFLGRGLGVPSIAEYPTFFGFVTVKLLVSLLVIYAIDISNREESRRYPTFMGLVKFAVIMVGIGPAIRNFTRMALGI